MQTVLVHVIIHLLLHAYLLFRLTSTATITVDDSGSTATHLNTALKPS